MDVIPYLSELNAAKFPQLFPVRHSFDLIRMPKKSELIAEIPEDYFLTFRMLKEGVEYFGPRSGTGLGFLQFHKEGLLFAGPFENFTRHGCGVTCCVKSEDNDDDEEEVIVDHEFEHDAQFEPVQAQNASIASCAIEVAVASGSGARLLVRSALSGLALLALDRRAAALFVGEMRAGRRLGEGVFRDAEGRLFRQTWTEGEDTLLTSLSLPQE